MTVESGVTGSDIIKDKTYRDTNWGGSYNLAEIFNERPVYKVNFTKQAGITTLCQNLRSKMQSEKLM